MPSSALHPPRASQALLKRFDIPGPRYTSYPTADRFVEAFAPHHYAQALQHAFAAARTLKRPLSVYVHIPFCEQLCYYCACNKIITRHHERGSEYLQHLAQELDIIRTHASSAESSALPQVSQLHLGGGSPTFLSDHELAALMQLLKKHFHLTAQAECSIEVDPRTVTTERLAHLRQLGFNRLSLGVQDFDAQVQKAVHREQSTGQVFALVEAARALGFESINVDLIYGLPKQTPASFEQTLVLIQRLQPDRIALYAYAHLPERFKPQRRIHAHDLPAAADKVHMHQRAQAALAQAGYVDIGMDHFALPGDGLALAKKHGCLHRNFQGYSTQADTDLIGLGVSSISKVGSVYSQNERSLEGYYDKLHQGQLPTSRGLALTRDDLVRRTIIMAIMCQGSIAYRAVEEANLLDFASYFAPELAQLAEFEANGLVALSDEGMEVTPLGWTFIRAIAMVFDKYLQADFDRQRFSRIL